MKKAILFVIIIILVIVVILAIWFFIIKDKDSKEEGDLSQLPITPADNGGVGEVQLKLFIGDQDRDGIPDEEEEKLGTSNRDFDTDGDGLSDKMEIEKWKTDPTNPDTDGDGFWDGVEIIKGYNPLGEGKLKNF